MVTRSKWLLVVTFKVTNPPSGVNLAAFDNKLKIILSILSVSSHPIILSGLQLMVNVRCLRIINGSRLRAVSLMYCITSPWLTSIFKPPACILLVSRICWSNRTLRWMFRSINSRSYLLSGCSSRSFSTEAEIMVRGVSSSWVILLNIKFICNWFLMRVFRAYNHLINTVMSITVQVEMNMIRSKWCIFEDFYAAKLHILFQKTIIFQEKKS